MRIITSLVRAVLTLQAENTRLRDALEVFVYSPMAEKDGEVRRLWPSEEHFEKSRELLGDR